jgi:hypothetical protein
MKRLVMLGLAGLALVLLAAGTGPATVVAFGDCHCVCCINDE